MFGFGGGNSNKNDIAALHTQLQEACRKYSNSKYCAQYVSWNDNSRTEGSCLGSNITDARLKGKNGENFFVVRPQNFNEKIGKVRPSDLALIVGSHKPLQEQNLEPKTLQDVLSNVSEHAGYAMEQTNACEGTTPEQHLHFGQKVDKPPSSGIPDNLLQSPTEPVGIRFQVVFLPGDAKEVFPDTYNYQTRSYDDPKNLILLCTSQGTFWQQDGPGSQPQYLHQYDSNSNQWRKKYLQVTRTEHGVSMGQQESAEERAKALKEGKAISTVIGTKGMGAGFNRLMTIQVPLKTKKSPARMAMAGGLFGAPGGGPVFGEQAPANIFAFGGGNQQMGPGCSSGGGLFEGLAQQQQCNMAMSYNMKTSAEPNWRVTNTARPHSVEKKDAKAARVSYGSDAGKMRKMNLKSPERDTTCAITVTVQFYFVVPEGSLIKDADIKKAIDVCEEAYRGCEWDGKLQGNPNANFAKDQPGASWNISNSVDNANYINPGLGNTNLNIFPTGGAPPSTTPAAPIVHTIPPTISLPPLLQEVWIAAEKDFYPNSLFHNISHAFNQKAQLVSAADKSVNGFISELICERLKTAPTKIPTSSITSTNYNHLMHSNTNYNINANDAQKKFDFLHDKVALAALDVVGKKLTNKFTTLNKLANTSSTLFLTKDMQAKNYKDACQEFRDELMAIAAVFNEAAALQTKTTMMPCGVAFYNIACCHALGGDEVTALHWLWQAAAAGYPNDGGKHVRADEDLHYIRLKKPESVDLCIQLADTVNQGLSNK